MNCRIADMLRAQKKGHISFHTPGHKRAGADITELSYSDNLYSPHGVIERAERDVAEILGATRSFLLTDGSTCGVFSMIYCVKASGGKRLAVPAFSHPSVFHACKVLGIEPVIIAQTAKEGIPLQPTEKEIAEAVKKADALLLTSPDYYGNFPPLEAARALLEEVDKLFLIDGAHGGHLHFTDLHAGKYADLWVDGVHKSLPALTQGAVVSAKTEKWSEVLKEAVRVFRTTSPSYPILASVEYAVKYPRNEQIEILAQSFKIANKCIMNADWTKILVRFGSQSDAAQEYLEKNGIYPEFNDGNYLMFYLSPCTKPQELKRLGKMIKKLPRGELKTEKAGEIPIYSEGA